MKPAWAAEKLPASKEMIIKLFNKEKESCEYHIGVVVQMSQETPADGKVQIIGIFD